MWSSICIVSILQKAVKNRVNRSISIALINKLSLYFQLRALVGHKMALIKIKVGKPNNGIELSTCMTKDPYFVRKGRSFNFRADESMKSSRIRTLQQNVFQYCIMTIPYTISNVILTTYLQNDLWCCQDMWKDLKVDIPKLYYFTTIQHSTENCSSCGISNGKTYKKANQLSKESIPAVLHCNRVLATVMTWSHRTDMPATYCSSRANALWNAQHCR